MQEGSPVPQAAQPEVKGDKPELTDTPRLLSIDARQTLNHLLPHGGIMDRRVQLAEEIAHTSPDFVPAGSSQSLGAELAAITEVDQSASVLLGLTDKVNDGEDISDLLKEPVPVPVKAAAKIASELIDALELGYKEADPPEVAQYVIEDTGFSSHDLARTPGQPYYYKGSITLRLSKPGVEPSLQLKLDYGSEPTKIPKSAHVLYSKA